jgi:hypothetical protein
VEALLIDESVPSTPILDSQNAGASRPRREGKKSRAEAPSMRTVHAPHTP